MSPVNRKYRGFYPFHINDHYSVFFRSSNDFCDSLSRHQFQNIPHPDREKLHIPVPEDDFIPHPASNFLCIPHPASISSPIPHPPKPMLDPLIPSPSLVNKTWMVTNLGTLQCIHDRHLFALGKLQVYLKFRSVAFLSFTFCCLIISAFLRYIM